jgi:hypothetical protein
MIAEIEKNGKYAKLLETRHSAAARERTSPPPSMKKSNFCIPPPSENGTPQRKATR